MRGKWGGGERKGKERKGKERKGKEEKSTQTRARLTYMYNHGMEYELVHIISCVSYQPTPTNSRCRTSVWFLSFCPVISPFSCLFVSDDSRVQNNQCASTKFPLVDVNAA